MLPSATLPSSGLGGPLYHKDQMPEHFQEHFIVTGYRHPKSSAWQCILSLFDATNETLNFWTHFLPSWYFMWALRGLSHTLDFPHDSYTWPLLCYLCACCVFPLASAFAHTFNVMSEKARHVCFFLDYAALSLFSFGISVSYHAYCFPRDLVDNGFYGVYVYGAAACAFLCTTASCVTRFMRPCMLRQCLRLSAFAVPYVFDTVPIAYRLFLCSEEECRLTSHMLHTRQTIFAVSAAFLYVSHLPERWKPGQFDIIGHSHQLFHVLTILGVMDQLQAVLQDMQERKTLVQEWMNFDLNNSIGLMSLVLLGNTLIIAAFSLYLYFAKNLVLVSSAGASRKCKCS